MKIKLILWTLVSLMILGSVYAGTADDMLAASVIYLKHNDTGTTGTAEDSSYRGVDGSITGATYDTGNFILGNASLDNTGANQYVEFSDDAAIDFTSGSFCAMAWVYWDSSSPGNQPIWEKDAASGTDGWRLYINPGANNVEFHSGGTIGANFGSFTYADYGNKWILLTGSFNGSHYQLWVNDTLQDTASGSNPGDNTEVLRLGQDALYSSEHFSGQIDDTIVMNTSCDQTMVDYFYNSGAGIQLTEQAAPTITLNYPVNATRYNSQTYTAQFNISTDISANCTTSVVSSDYTSVNTTQTGNTEHLFSPIGSIGEGTQSFNTTCTNDAGTTLLDWQFEYDDVTPPITWQSPAYTNVTSSQSVSLFKINSSDTNLYQMFINVTYPNGTLMTEKLIADINTTSYEMNTTVTFDTFGEYTFCAQASDDHTANVIPNYKASILGNTVRFETEHGTDIIIYPQNPLDFTTSQIDIEKKKDRYSFTFGTPSAVRQTKNFIVSSSHVLDYIENSEYDGHFVSNNNWIDFETSDSGQSVSVTKIDEYTYRVRVTSYSFDFQSVGGLNINTQCITYNYLDTKNRATISAVEYTQDSPVTITSASYTDIVTGTFNNSVVGNLSFYAIGNIEGGGGNVIATCGMFANGVLITNVTLSPANNQINSYHMHSGILNYSVGVINGSIACKKDGTSNFDVYNTEAVIFQFTDEDLENLKEKNNQAQFNVTSPTYTSLGNITITSSPANANTSLQNSIVIEADVGFNFDSTGTICLNYSYGGHSHNNLCRYGSAGSSGSGSIHGIIENITENTDYSLMFRGFSSTSDGSVDIDIDTFEITTTPNEISHLPQQNLAITSTTYQPLFNDTVIVNQTGDTIIAYGSLSMESLSGSSDVSIFWSLDNGDQINGSAVERSFSAANQFGIISEHQQFVNLTQGTYTITMYASASNSNMNVSLVDYVVYPSRTIFSTSIEYNVYAYDRYNFTRLNTYNVTVESTGSIYTTTNGLITIPRGVLSENITINATGYYGNITFNHNTLTNLNQSLQPLPLSPGISLNISPSNTIVEGTTSIVTGNACPSELNCVLYRDGVAVANPDTQNLSVGVYIYRFNTSGNINYTSQTVLGNISVVSDPGEPECSPQNDDAVYYNESYTWYTDCFNNDVNILWFNISCDNGFTNNIFVNSTTYQYVNTTGPLLNDISCTITTNTEYGVLTYSQNILNRARSYLMPGSCDTTDGGMSLLWMILAISLGLYVMSFVSRAPIFMIISGIGFIISSWYISACVSLFSYILIAVGTFVIIQAVYNTSKKFK